MIYWLGSEMLIGDLCIDPQARSPFTPDFTGGQLDIGKFLSILELNPEMREYEFGLTGRPSNILIVLLEGEQTHGYIGSYKLLESLSGSSKETK